MFWFRVAGHLGSTVSELKGRMSQAELMHWMAFDSIHGLDDIRLEFQLGRIAAMFSPGKARPIDFMPFRKKRPQSVDEAMATLDSIGGK